MKHTIRKTAAVAAIVAASALAMPVAAQASTIYPPSNACSVVPTVITPGATVTFNCSNGTFTPGEFVSVRVTGNTSAKVGFIKFAVTSTGGTNASAQGAISVPISFPANANGGYNIEAFSETSAGGVSSVSVKAAGSGAGSSSDDLATTGGDSASLLGLWVGGGALVLTGGALAVAATVRRNRKQNAGV
ncbi:cell wall protein [Microbacterium sp. F51-2R]|jgi:hypothetical protein|uniref:cell wall protein n=1 Tax=Microbacterium sp. F51-2R TaxID=3445777 RepID=UPI003FA04D92